MSVDQHMMLICVMLVIMFSIFSVYFEQICVSYPSPRLYTTNWGVVKINSRGDGKSTFAQHSTVTICAVFSLRLYPFRKCVMASQFCHRFFHIDTHQRIPGLCAQTECLSNLMSGL